MISIKQLKYFDAVARTGHFGRAARQCAVSQPALSMQVQELEKALGIQLLERGPRGVMLTERGREIARRAARVLADVRDLGDYAAHQDRLLTGALRFGVIPSVAPYLLPPLLPRLREQYPDLELHIRETQTHQLVTELVDGALDLLLLALPVEHPDIETRALLEDRFLLATPKSRRMAAHVRVTPDVLCRDRLLLLEEGHCLREQALAVCNLRQVDNIDTFGASSLSTIVQMVSNGLGTTLLPELCLELEKRHGEIRLMRFADPEPSRTLGLAWRKSSPRQGDFVELGKLVTAVGEKLKRRSGSI
jgi:LysR family hydrogen peroxide-inducible transcriptional activator